jgi:hypothetical protein
MASAGFAACMGGGHFVQQDPRALDVYFSSSLPRDCTSGLLLLFVQDFFFDVLDVILLCRPQRLELASVGPSLLASYSAYVGLLQNTI